MDSLSLRSRVLIGVALVALVQVLAALAIVSLTGDQLLDEIDDRLESSSSAAGRSATGDAPPADAPVGELFLGVIEADGTLTTVRAATDRAEPLPPPSLAGVRPSDLLGEIDTAPAVSTGLEYRVTVVETGDGELVVVAAHLDDYRGTMNRLIQVVAATSIALALLLAAVTWWVLRLGIAPLKRMTGAAEAIAAGDLSARIEDLPKGTEAGDLGDALNAMLGQIERSFDDRIATENRLRQFLADASHELRTPVATVRGYAELYAAGGLTEQDALDDAMDRALRESERMSRLIGEMLDLAKLDRSPAIGRGLVVLGDVVTEVVADATVAHPGRMITIEVDDGDSRIVGDADLLRQAIANVVGNALVHGPDARVAVSVTVDEEAVAVHVVDDGDGMAPAVVQRATERFFRGDPARTRARGGSGLGLAIVDGVVAAHAGELNITSTSGLGTTVTLSFPAGSASADSQPTHR